MAWSTPRTWVVGEIVTASMMNSDVRDNMTDLDARTQIYQAAIDTDQSTASTTFTDLTTVGPALTVVTGTKALVITTATFYNDNAGHNVLMSYALSGATTGGAVDNNGPRMQIPNALYQQRMSVAELVNLNAGSNTFTAKYRVTGGTGHWLSRKIHVIPGNKLS